MAWVKKNLTLSVVITLICGYTAGAMAYAKLQYDVENLKVQIATMPERLVRLEENTKYIKEGVDRLLRREIAR